MNIKILSLDNAGGSTALKIAGFALALAMLFGVAYNAYAALTEAQIQSILDLLASFGADQATIANVNSALRGQPTSGTPPVSEKCNFTRDLSVGSQGADVKCLQQYLNSAGYQLAASGPGSPGNETEYFGPLTRDAVIRWQNANAAEVLAPVGLSSGTGYWGPSSRAHYNNLVAAAETGSETGSETPSVPGTGLTVAAGTQPQATLAPESAAGVPFTVFTLTAGADGDVTVNSITVEKRGLMDNSVFSGVALMEGDRRLTVSKTLNSDDRVTFSEPLVVKAGETRTITIVADMASNLDAQAGQVGSLALVEVDAGDTVVNGVLPIIGASHNINATLSLGTATAEKGALDPNGAQTKEVNSTGVDFASIKITAGSAEDIRLRSIRWEQSGSASASDLANVVVRVDGVDYATVVSGDYYSATFDGGIVISKGTSKDVTIRGDIVGGAGRTIQFDVEEETDVYITGETFGYGITPSAASTGSSSDGSEFTTGVPFYDASKFTISKGSLVVSASNDVPVGNVANGANSIALGAFRFNVTGEGISWTKIKFTIATDTSGSDEKLTNITLNLNGNVIAGPQDPTSKGDSVTLSDTVNLPVGDHVLVVKGNLNNKWDDGDTIKFSLNPSSDITNVKGTVSNQTITPTPSASVSANQQTVKAGALSVVPASSLADRNIIDGATGVTLGRFVLDATASGEDLKVSVIKIRAVTGTNADVDELDSLQLFDGSTPLNTGSNIVNPSGHSGGADATLTFTLDGGGLILSKGTSKVLDLKGNVNASSTPTSDTTYKFDFTNINNSDWTVVGVNTGTEITVDLDTSTAGALMTIVSSGSMKVAVSPADPTEKWYDDGSEEVIGVYRYTATNEDMKLAKVTMRIESASSSAADFQSVSLWDGSTKLVEKLSPAWNSNEETFDLEAAGVDFVVPNGEEKDLYVKATFANIGTTQPGTAGHLVRVVATSTTASNNTAVGTESGQRVNITASADVATSSGARYFKAVPKVAYVGLDSSQLGNGTKTLYKFSVTATGGDVGLYKFTFKIATTGVTVTSPKLTESPSGKTVDAACSNPDDNGITECIVNSTDYGASEITVPSGSTYTYELTGTVSGAGTGDSVTVQLEGDAEYPALASTFMDTAATIDGDTDDDFIWSDRSKSSHSTTTKDWTNGYKVPGLPTTNLSQSVLSL